MEVLITEIKLKKGFFKVKSYELSLDQYKISLHSGEDLIVIPYSCLKEIIITNGNSKSTRVEIVTSNEIIEGILANEEDVENLVKIIRRYIDKNINFSLIKTN